MKKNFNYLWKGLLILTCCLFTASISFAQQWGRWCYKDYTSSGDFKVPVGCTKVYFEAVGGGGASGFLASTGLGAIEEANMHNYYKVSGGGGGGAYGRSATIESGLTAGETFAIVVGLGGRNTATSITKQDYIDDCDRPDWTHLITCAHTYDHHTLYRKFYNGDWYTIVGWDNSTLIPTAIWGDSRWPFYKNRYHRHGGTSSVKRNSTNSMVLEAHGGKTVGATVNDINVLAGGAGGDTGGAGYYHRRGGNGGDAIDRCGAIGYDEGAISAGGGGAAGFYGDYDFSPGSTYHPDHRTEAYCDKEEGFGRGGTGHEPFWGWGGEGTSDWAWDADSHNGSSGDPGSLYGGGGGGCKQGLVGWTNGADGADGIVRVWFYIEDRAISVVPTASPATITGSGSSYVTAGVSNQLVESGAYQTNYSWNNGKTTAGFNTGTLSGDATYCVTVTNVCVYATNSDACRATNNGCVTVKVNPITPGSIKVDETTWVCNPGDTVVTIQNEVSATTGAGDYFWQSSTDNSTWHLIGGANAPQYTASATGYYRRGYSEGTLDPVYSNSVHITHPSDITPGTIKDASNGTTTNVCSGGNVSVNLSYTGMAPGTYSVTWQTSTDKEHWTPVSSVTPLSYTGLTTTTYVRYLCNYTTSCNVPSNNIYTINVWELPVVEKITAPTDLCPGKTSYTVTATVTEGDATINTYNWTGVGVSGSSTTGTITPTLPNCNTTYNYCLKVVDANGCQSAEKCGTFTTENPTWNLGAVANVIATSGGNCDFTIPSNAILKAAVDAALTSTCGNEVTLSNILPAPGTPIISNQDVTATATDMCGGTHSVTIPVVLPPAPTVTVAPTTGEDGMLLCPGETTTLQVSTTAEDPTYQWTPSSLGNGAQATTIAYDGEDVTAHSDYYSVVVTDKYGCTETGGFYVYTTPKAYIANKEYTICSDKGATMSLATDDKEPTGNNSINSLTFNYNTTYTWTISTPNPNITGATEVTTGQANFTTGNLYNATLETQTIVYTVTPNTNTSTTYEGAPVTNDCAGAPFTVTVNVKPKVTNTGAITNFDASDVIITLWYGACDTLYNVTTPTYDNNIDPADLIINLTNDKGGSVNSGTILGRIGVNEYIIRWTFTDECGNSIYFDKKYIVRYPNCGDADPNYPSEQPYTVTDVDNNVYHTVRIGCECWTASNLRTVTGAANSSVYQSSDYPNVTENEEKFGRLYSWYTAVNVPENDNSATPTVSTAAESNYNYVRGICPEGWAIPNSYNLSSMVSIAGGADAVKSSSNLYWLPGAEGTDASGFGARGAGYYDPSIDRYVNLMGETYFWSYESSSSFMAKCGVITYYCPQLMIEEKLKGMGYSIRCIRRENP